MSKFTRVARVLAAVVTLALGSLAAHAEDVKLALNWVPEPQFGGFYEADRAGYFKEVGLNVTILKGGAGAPTWQMVATKKVEFAIAAADQVVASRSKNEADIVGLFAVYQNNPHAIMTHAEAGYKEIGDVFKGGTLALEVGLAHGKFLKNKYGFNGVKVVPYAGGITNFLADKKYSQQCFATSEPLSAKAKGANTKTFLIADSGYNPYTTLVIVQGDYLKANPAVAERFIKAVRKGWDSYLKDPSATNTLMAGMNKTMDLPTFKASAEVQVPMIATEETKKNGLGTMSKERWETLIKQLVDLGEISSAPAAADCFREMK